VTFLKDVLRGDEHYEIRLKLLHQSPENYPFKDDD
jgi:trafficking protein particle complex subunit 3